MSEAKRGGPEAPDAFVFSILDAPLHVLPYNVQSAPAGEETPQKVRGRHTTSLKKYLAAKAAVKPTADADMQNDNDADDEAFELMPCGDTVGMAALCHMTHHRERNAKGILIKRALATAISASRAEQRAEVRVLPSPRGARADTRAQNKHERKAGKEPEVPRTASDEAVPRTASDEAVPRTASDEALGCSEPSVSSALKAAADKKAPLKVATRQKGAAPKAVVASTPARVNAAATPTKRTAIGAIPQAGAKAKAKIKVDRLVKQPATSTSSIPVPAAASSVVRPEPPLTPVRKRAPVASGPPVQPKKPKLVS
jgi:hypothetical protein